MSAPAAVVTYDTTYTLFVESNETVGAMTVSLYVGESSSTHAPDRTVIDRLSSILDAKAPDASFTLPNESASVSVNECVTDASAVRLESTPVPDAMNLV